MHKKVQHLLDQSVAENGHQKKEVLEDIFVINKSPYISNMNRYSSLILTYNIENYLQLSLPFLFKIKTEVSSYSRVLQVTIISAKQGKCKHLDFA